VSILILLAASFVMFNLVALSTDPLEDLRSSNNPNKQQLIEARIQLANLDVAPPLRWAMWVGGAAKCLIPFANACDLGTTFQGAPVTDVLPIAMVSTIQMVTAALLLAILFGISTGILSALRENSGFDVSFTVLSLFLYSLPSFLAAALQELRRHRLQRLPARPRHPHRRRGDRRDRGGIDRAGGRRR
jgi:peptide/nickel transport system permease protein